MVTGLGEDDEQVEKILLFPNPSKEGLLGLTRSCHWSVTNVLGESLKIGEGNTIDLSGHPKGVYLIEIDRKITRVVFD